MSERWRCFVAVPIGDALRDALAQATSAWAARMGAADLRWTDPAGWHVTLAFLGDVDAGRVPGIAERLPGLVGRQPTIALVGEGLVPWPHEDEARMAWCRFRPDFGLAELHNRVAGGLGVTERRRFRPHVTLARVRGGRTARLAPPPPIPLPVSTVDQVVLFRSHPDPAGTTYEPLASVRMEAVPA